MSAQDALRKAAGEIGYYAPADPAPGSKYGRWEAERLNQPWLAGPSWVVWWCVIFISWVLDGLADVPGLPGYNTDRLRGLARANTLPNMHDAQPGDLVIFDWDKSTAATNHIGIVEINAGDYLQTIEGNTSGSDGPHQSNGNGVWRRTRSWDAVVAVIRPNWIDGTAAPVIPVSNPVVVTPTPPAPHGPVVIAQGIPAPAYPLPRGWYFGWLSGPKESVSGYYGHRADLQRWQQRMKDRGWVITADGLYGAQTEQVAHDFQVEKGLGVDGLIGRETWGAAWTQPVTRG